MEITLTRVVEAARERRAAVTAEGAGYIVLLALQRLATSPRQVTADLVGLTPAGDIELGPSPSAQPREVETQLRQLLTALLSLSQSAPPALKATGGRATIGDLSALEAELAAALIPINHAAAHRALARLFRETQKAMRPSLPASSSDGAASSLPPGAVSQPGSESSAPFSRGSAAAPAFAGLPVATLTPVVAAPMVALTPVVAAPVVALTPVVAAPVVALTPVVAPPVVALTPVVAASELAAVPPPSAWLAAAEFEFDVDIILADADAALRSDAWLDSAVAADGELAANARAADNEVAADRSAEGRVEVAPATIVPAATHATLAEADGADCDIEIEEVDAIDELLTADDTPVELRFTSLSSAPCITINDDVDGIEESPLPDSAPLAAFSEPEPPPYRSDLVDLLAGYLSHTRCEAHMTADLRRMIGLEPRRGSAPAMDRTELGR